MGVIDYYYVILLFAPVVLLLLCAVLYYKIVLPVTVGDCYVTLYERPDGKSLGAGLVEFRDLSKAQEAVDKMNRYEVSGRKIIVREVSILVYVGIYQYVWVYLSLSQLM